MGILANARSMLLRRRHFLQLLASGITGFFFQRGAVKGGVFAEQPTKKEPTPSPEPAWKAEFRQAYGLKEDEVLKRVASPFPACRIDYCKFLKAKYFPSMNIDKVSMTYRFDGKNVTFWALSPAPDGVGLLTLLENVGIPSQEIEIAEDWRFKQIPGEFVVRAGASVEKTIPRLERILREDLHLPVRLTWKQVEREVIVVRGKYESRPRANRKVNEVDLFSLRPNDDGGRPGGRGTLDAFLKWVGSWIDRPIVNDLRKKPECEIVWFFHPSKLALRGPDPNQDADGVLKNIAAQTGLTFEKEKRKVRILCVKSE